MKKTTSGAHSEQSLSRRISFAVFSIFRQVKTVFHGTLPTVEPQSAIQVADTPSIPTQMTKKGNLFFRIIEFFYSFITSPVKSLFAGIDKIVKTVLSPARRIGAFLFEKILDITEWIYTFFLYPFYNRFGHIFHGFSVVLKSKAFGIVALVIFSGFLSRIFLTSPPRATVIFAFVPLIFVSLFFFPIVGLSVYIMFGLGMLQLMIWQFPKIYTGSPLILLSIISYSLRVLVGKEKEFNWIQDNMNLLVLTIWSIVTIALFRMPSSSYYYLTFVSWFPVYFLTIQIIGLNKQRLYIFLHVLLFVYGLYAFKVIRNAIYYGVGTWVPVTGNTSGRLGDNNELAASLLMMFPLFVGLALVAKNNWLKRGLFFSSMIIILAVIYTNSRGAMVGFAVIIGPLLFKLILKNKKVRLKGIIIALVIAIAAFSFFQEKLVSRVESIQDWKTDMSALNRIAGILTGFNAMRARPVWGIGIGMMCWNFADWFPGNTTIRYWPGEDGTVTVNLPPKNWAIEVHNAYAALAGECGFFVLVLWLSLFFYSFRQLHYLRRILPKTPENEWAHILSHALQLSTVSYMVTALFLNNANLGLTYVIFAASTSLRHVALRQKGAVEATSLLWLLLLLGIWAYLTVGMRLGIVSVFG